MNYMKPAGIVRKVDQLGRVVLPKSLRKKHLMNQGDPIEILVSGDRILLEKYRPKCVFCGEMEQIAGYKEKHICLNCLSEINQMSG